MVKGVARAKSAAGTRWWSIRIRPPEARERRGQDWLGPELGLAPRTASRILRRHDVPRLCVCDPITGEVIRASKTTAVRYERSRPGELVHVEVKKIGKIPDGGGWKAHGRQIGKTSAQKKARIGYDYVHSMVDDHSRAAYSEILPDEQGPTCAGFIARAAAAFAARGIARIERVMTDNHWSYTKSDDVAAVLTTLQATHVLIKPHCPRQNGKVERYNRILQTEWAYRHLFTSRQCCSPRARGSPPSALWRRHRKLALPGHQVSDSRLTGGQELRCAPGCRTYAPSAGARGSPRLVRRTIRSCVTPREGFLCAKHIGRGTHSSFSACSCGQRHALALTPGKPRAPAIETRSSPTLAHSPGPEVPRPLDLTELRVKRSVSEVSVQLQFPQLTVQ